MKKLIYIFLSFLLLFILSGCSEDYNLSKKAILTDVTINKINVKTKNGEKKYDIDFVKDDKKQNLHLKSSSGYTLKEELKDIKKISSLVGSKEEILFDLIIDKNEIIMVTLSKNRN